MFLIKLLLKVFLLPLIGVITLIQWGGIFLTSFSTVLLDLLAGTIFLIAIAGLLMGISAGAETIQTLAVGFVFFLIPRIAEWIIIKVAAINCCLRNLLKS